VVARYAQGLNIHEPFAILRYGVTSYHEQDCLGSVTSLTNSSGSIANTYTYDSFGNLTASSGTLTNSFRYTARESDTETGLYYYRARYYDPSTERFVSEDPLGPRNSDVPTDLFEYVTNSPVNFVDPRGLYVLDKHQKVPPFPPSGPIILLLICTEKYLGEQLIVTSTSEHSERAHHFANTPHGRGEAVDVGYPKNPSKLLCCAAQCEAGTARDEKVDPSKHSTGDHIHLGLFPDTKRGRGDLPPPCKTRDCNQY